MDMFFFFLAELSMRKNCRDNVTMFLGHKIVVHCTFLGATPFRHRNLNIYRIFPVKLYYIVTLSLSRSWKQPRAQLFFILPVRCCEEVKHGCYAEHRARRNRVPLKPEGEEGRRDQNNTCNKCVHLWQGQ